MTEPSTPSPVASAPPTETHVRFNETLLSGHERHVLQAIARRLPAAFTPDRLTTFGVFGALLVMVGYALSNCDPAWLWLANLGLVIHWFGDSLDGTVARFRKIERPRYGFYLDQVIDTLGNTLIALGVGLSPWIRMDLVLIVLALYHMLSIQIYVRAIVDREFHMAVGRLGPTELRVGIVVLNCFMLAFGQPRAMAEIGGLTWPDVLMVAVSLMLLVMYALQMRRHLARFAAEDPPHS